MIDDTFRAAQRHHERMVAEAAQEAAAAAASAPAAAAAAAAPAAAAAAPAAAAAATAPAGPHLPDITTPPLRPPPPKAHPAAPAGPVEDVTAQLQATAMLGAPIPAKPKPEQPPTPTPMEIQGGDVVPASPTPQQDVPMEQGGDVVPAEQQPPPAPTPPAITHRAGPVPADQGMTQAEWEEAHEYEPDAAYGTHERLYPEGVQNDPLPWWEQPDASMTYEEHLAQSRAMQAIYEQTGIPPKQPPPRAKPKPEQPAPPLLQQQPKQMQQQQEQQQQQQPASASAAAPKLLQPPPLEGAVTPAFLEAHGLAAGPEELDLAYYDDGTVCTYQWAKPGRLYRKPVQLPVEPLIFDPNCNGRPRDWNKQQQVMSNAYRQQLQREGRWDKVPPCPVLSPFLHWMAVRPSYHTDKPLAWWFKRAEYDGDGWAVLSYRGLQPPAVQEPSAVLARHQTGGAHEHLLLRQPPRQPPWRGRTPAPSRRPPASTPSRTPTGGWPRTPTPRGWTCTATASTTASCWRWRPRRPKRR